MQNLLFIPILLFLTSCGLLPPEIASPVGQQGVRIEDSSIICGDRSDVYAVFYYDNISINAIAIDGDLAPAFVNDKKNIIGVRTIPNLNSYCLRVPAGQHKIIFVAERQSGIGYHGGTSYYAAECSMQLIANVKYVVGVRRSGKWYSGIVALMKDLDSGEFIEECDLNGAQHYKSIFVLIDSLKK